jgi:hypothetical protein
LHGYVKLLLLQVTLYILLIQGNKSKVSSAHGPL